MSNQWNSGVNERPPGPRAHDLYYWTRLDFEEDGGIKQLQYSENCTLEALARKSDDETSPEHSSQHIDPHLMLFFDGAAKGSLLTSMDPRLSIVMHRPSRSPELVIKPSEPWENCKCDAAFSIHLRAPVSLA